MLSIDDRATLSIGDVPPLRGILKGDVKTPRQRLWCPPLRRPGTMPSSSAATLTMAPLPGHLGTTPSSSAATLTTAPPPGHPGTMPSSSAATLTTAFGRGAPPAEGRPQRTTARPTTLGTLQCPSSFDGSDPVSTKATHTISSTLDDLQLDITLQIHERICEFFSPWHYPLLLRNRCIQWKGRRRSGGIEAGKEVGRELPPPI